MMTRRDLAKLAVAGLPAAAFSARHNSRIAGVTIGVQSYSFRDDFSDEEIRRGFEMARALGVKTIEASANNTTAIRVDAFAARAGMYAAVHRRTCCCHRFCRGFSLVSGRGFPLAPSRLVPSGHSIIRCPPRRTMEA